MVWHPPWEEIKQRRFSRREGRSDGGSTRGYDPFPEGMYLFLFLAVLRLHWCLGFSLVADSRGYSLAVVHRLLIAVASLVAEHGL